MFLIPTTESSSCLPRLAVGAKRLADLSLNTAFLARNRRACPERSRRNPGDAYWQMLFAAFRPQEIKKITASERSAAPIDRLTQRLWRGVEEPVLSGVEG